MSKPKDETLSIFVLQLHRKIHQMWHYGESRDAALAEAAGRLEASGGVKRYVHVPLAGRLIRRITDRAAEDAVSAAYGAHACAHDFDRYR
jgi:hypothetical protein